MPQSPFVVSVGHLLRAPGDRCKEVRSGPLAGLAVTASAVPEDAEVTVAVTLDAVPGGVVATGRVTAPWVGPCRRCLAEASGTIAAEVREVFEEEHDPEQTYPIHGDRLDLEPLARDTVLLELPLAPLCREDCAGICPMCGTDRNMAPCRCVEAPKDPRWADLDALSEN